VALRAKAAAIMRFAGKDYVRQDHPIRRVTSTIDYVIELRLRDKAQIQRGSLQREII
jgi:hypothetical protein